ncbi:sensor histidine kinase [Halorubrum sp. SD626R]|uniref:GAF domain-containing sensor histidine kinase n=1 Tax=Halorubrum sp. SD626R TaxID=1419722 RepID=UPI0010F84BAA|nr:GAF domain-containing sensor histidine kinase [Halorubrum sp. SD626R]TKX78173.1 sensor histidine kinase [Halorubrum sp. SD626R]
MHRRSVVTFVGDDPGVRDRVARAIESAWGGSRVPDLRAVGAAEVVGARADDTDPLPLTDVCGIVATGRAVADDAVAENLSATPEGVPVIVVLEETTADGFRSALRAGPSDVVTEAELDAEAADEADTDVLTQRLAERVSPGRIRFSVDDADRLREVLLDAGSTLMSTRTDEVDTKITWTMANVGEHAEADRIVCYLRDGETFDPRYVWCPDGCDTASCSLDEFPQPDRLTTFENVVHSSAQSTAERRIDDSERVENETAGEPPATVHVPLVADWELIGVLSVETDAWRTWIEEEVDLYRTFADLIAHTIARNDRRLEIRRRTEQLEQFSSVVSHDLRNPLNVLSGYVDMIDDEISPSKHAPMDRAITRMETLLDNLLMLAKRGETIGETEPTPVCQVAEDAWTSIRAPHATLTLADEIGTVQADPLRLRQLFENLFRNAVEHGGPRVDIEIGPRDGADGVGMYIADDGPGVSPAVSDSLFDSGVSTADSSGIGLAIVSRIADAHGWEVDVTNDDGAVFDISFEAPTAVEPT